MSNEKIEPFLGVIVYYTGTGWLPFYPGGVLSPDAGTATSTPTSNLTDTLSAAIRKYGLRHTRLCDDYSNCTCGAAAIEELVKEKNGS